MIFGLRCPKNRKARAAKVAGACALVIEALEYRRHFTATVGLEFIGLSSTTQPLPDNPAIVAGKIKTSGVKNPVIAILPFEFNPTNPFAQATKLIEDVLPTVPVSLSLDIYVKWFPHDVAQGVNDQNAFWRTCDSAGTVDPNFVNRVHQIDLFMNSMNAWAQARGLANKLHFLLIPVLEDSCSNPAEYVNLIARIHQKQTNDGTAFTPLRRSALVQNAFHVAGASLEVHGTWSQASPFLSPNSGDTWTSDGASEAYIHGQFLSDEKLALAAGINVLFWDLTFNGSAPYQPYNEASRVVDPFTPDISEIVVQTFERN
jgi:hypothetical protein